MWKILLVDDDFGTRKLINRLLHRRALVDHACNGEEALEGYNMSVLHQDPYDLIMLDVTMPDLDGVSVLERVRSDEKGRGIRLGEGTPIVMITGRKDTMMASFGEGCDDYIVKPFEPKALLQKIEQLVNARKK